MKRNSPIKFNQIAQIQLSVPCILLKLWIIPQEMYVNNKNIPYYPQC